MKLGVQLFIVFSLIPILQLKVLSNEREESIYNHSYELLNQDLELNYCDDDNDGFMTFDIQDIEDYVLQNIGQENNYFQEQILISTSDGNIFRVDSPSTSPSLTLLCNYDYAITDIAVNLEREITICSNNFIKVNDDCAFDSYPYDAFQINSLSFDNLGYLYYGYGNESYVRRVEIIDDLFYSQIWHDFEIGTSAGDFVLLNDKMYIAWQLSNDNFRLYEVTINDDNNYVSHIDLGQIPNQTYGLASELGTLYGVTVNKLYEINLDSFTFTNIIQNSDPLDQWYGAAGLHEAIVFNTSTHLTIPDAENSLNALSGDWTNTISGGQTIYIKIENSLTGEYEIVNLIINIGNYPNVNPPDDLASCSDGSFHIFNLNDIESGMLINTEDSLVFTYYINLENAENNIEPISSIYESTSAIQTIYVRVKNSNNDCYLIYDFDLININSPSVASLSSSLQPTLLTECYIDQNNQGFFNFNDVLDTVILEEGDFIYEYYLNFTDAENGINQIFSPYYLTNQQQEIVIKVINNGGCYSITNFFIDNDCIENNISTSNLFFPKYFTPNGDNIHDYWNVSGLSQKLKNESTITIYDRYGKVLDSFKPNATLGWDGIFKGNLLPTTDYWFSFQTNFGYSKFGHFSLVR